MSESTVNIKAAKDRPNEFVGLRNTHLEVITEMSQNFKSKIPQRKLNGLTSPLQYVIIPKSISYEFIIPMIESNSLKFEVVQFFMDQTLDSNILVIVVA